MSVCFPNHDLAPVYHDVDSGLQSGEDLADLKQGSCLVLLETVLISDLSFNCYRSTVHLWQTSLERGAAHVQLQNRWDF